MVFDKRKLEIRKAGRKELYTITVLTRKFFPYTKFNMQMIAKRLRNKNIQYLAALYKGYTVGFMDFKENAKSIKIMGLAVIPEMQGNGIGRKLAEEALEFAGKRKKEVVYLLVGAENSIAISMYEKLGFKLKGKLERKIWGMDVLLLYKLLKQGRVRQPDRET